MTTMKDTDIREALRRKYAETPQLPADFTLRMHKATGKKEGKRAHFLWLYPALAVAASVVLLFSVGIIRNFRDSKQSDLVAQTDTLKKTPQTEIKKVKKQPLQKVKNTEATDTVKMMKERYRAPRPPRHYMAKVETAENAPEPEVIDAELVAKAMIEEERQAMMEMIAKSQTNSSLHTDFESMTKEIRRRGEHMSQHVVMAMSNEEE